ncbi:MAG TPA: tetratricopeptide repeat protein [Blastocatellia bacterium]|nr:tetratricopeptide repeat protein [Blastocatellia bacterium]
MGSTLEIHLLGPFRVAVDGAAIDARRWSRRSAALLVKLLALQPHHQLHREQAMEFLWPELDPQAAANNLHKTIHAARRALEPSLRAGADSHFILTQAQQIRLSAPGELWIDVAAFEQQAAQALEGARAQAYEHALALYAGDLLIEDLYADWAAARREPLRALRQDLLAQLARLLEAEGQYARSIERLKELLADDPTNEAAHRHLMRLYAESGSRHQALQQYRQCRDLLRRELDAELDQATVELYRQIAAGRVERRVAGGAEGGAVGQSIDSLAILPLANAAADPDAEYLADGITEGIINSLAHLRQLRVMARSTVFRYKDKPLDPQRVGRELGVRAVMTGRVLQVGETLIVSAELVDTADGAQLWGEQYNRRLSDILAVQADIAREVSEKLRLRLSGEEQERLARPHTDNSAAYQNYLKGRYYWNKRTEEGLNKSLEYFEQAINLDANYALAYVGLADDYAFLGDIGVTALPPNQAFARARAAVARALEIDDSLAEAHTSLAHLHMHGFEWPAAASEFRRALELGPNYATTHHWYAYYWLFVGRWPEALAEITRARELDPLSLPINTDVGEIYYFQRQYDRAIEEIRKALEMDPYYFKGHLNLGRACLQKGLIEEALAALARACELAEENAPTLADLGRAYALAGRRQEALGVLGELLTRSADRYVSPYDIALVYSGLGDTAQAIEWLYRAYDERAQWMIFLAVDPRFESLHADQRFRELVARLGLTLVEGPARIASQAAHSERHQPIDSLAILPLTNATSDAGLEYLADGVTESLINHLSQLSGLKVMAWSTVLRYKDSPKDPQTVGRELGIRAVLTGRVLQLDDRLVIKAELVDAADGSQLWGEHYNRKLADIFAIEAEIASEISNKLRLKLSGEEQRRLAKRHTENIDAYHAYLKGRYYWNKRTIDWLKKGVECFKQAIDLDPSYAAAYAGLSDSYTLLVVHEALPPAEGFVKAKAAAAIALQIDESLGEAHASLAHAMLHNWEWEEAEREFKRALHLNPGYASAHHWYSEYLYATGRLDEAIVEVKRAVELAPLSLIINTHLGDVLYYARRYEQSAEQCRKGLELDANFALARMDLGRAYGQMGRYEEALDELRQAAILFGDSLEGRWWAGLFYAAWGKPGAARAVLDELKTAARDRYVSPYGIALIHAALDENDRAFEWLEKAYQAHDGELFNLKVEPQFDRLRMDARFADLLRRMGLAVDAATGAVETRAATEASARRALPQSLAVLPFKPIRAEGRDASLEVGMADALINRLSHLSRLAVKSVSSVRKYAESEQDAQAVGRELQVEAVLEGSIQRLGERLRISARLLRVSDGCALWADRFDERFTDIFAVEDSISEKVAAALAVQLTGDERRRLTKRYTEDPEAYQLYLKGRYFWNKRIKGGFKKAIDYFNRAVALDPDYALAYAGLADCYAVLSWYSLMAPALAFSKARTAALRALEIDDTLAEAHTALAAVKQCYEWDWPAAEREFRRAIELNPGYATAHHWYAINHLTAMGRHEEAIREMRRAQTLDPLSLVINRDVGWAFYYARRYGEAIAAYRRTFELDPNFVRTHFFLGMAYEQTGEYQQAIARFHEAESLYTKGSARAWTLLARARIQVAAGRPADAHNVMEELEALATRHYVSPFLIATIYSGLAAPDQAFAWLGRAYEARDPYLTFLNVEPALDPLRADERFADLLRRVGLAD